MIDLDRLPRLDRLDTDELLSLLGDIAADLEATNALAARLYEARNAIYVEARRRTPPVTQRRLASVARTTDVAVIAALRKAKAG